MTALVKFFRQVVGLAFSVVFLFLAVIVVWWLLGFIPGARDLTTDLLGAAWAVLRDLGREVAAAARTAAEG